MNPANLTPTKTYLYFSIPITYCYESINHYHFTQSGTILKLTFSDVKHSVTETIQ